MWPQAVQRSMPSVARHSRSAQSSTVEHTSDLQTSGQYTCRYHFQRKWLDQDTEEQGLALRVETEEEQPNRCYHVMTWIDNVEAEIGPKEVEGKLMARVVACVH